MANYRFDGCSEDILKGLIHWVAGGDTFKMALIDLAKWTPSKTTSNFLSEASAAIVGTPATLTNLTNTDGVAGADDVTLANVTGDSCEAVLLYKDTGDPATSRLMHIWDTPAVAGQLPTTPANTNYTLRFEDGIFSLQAAA